MKKFTKLALVSSIAFSANAMAMQAMDDATLSATTGQDGINIGIGISKISIDKLYVHDNDGLSLNAKNTVTGTSVTGVDATTGLPTFSTNTVVSDKPITGGTATAGAIVIKGNGQVGHVNEKAGLVITANNSALLASHNLADLQIDSDAGNSTTGGAFINIGAQVSGLTINIGEIGVTASNAGTTTGATSIRRGGKDDATGSDKNYNSILSGLTLKTGQMAANVQLGATPQGAMIKLETVMKGGLEISDLGINDSAGGGQIWLGKIQVADASSTDLTIKSDIKVKTNGLEITNTQNASGTDIYIQAIALGAKPAGVDANTPFVLGARGTATAGSIGDVEIQGLKTFTSSGLQGSVITISGR